MKKPPLLYAFEQVQMRRCAVAQFCRFADDRATQRRYRLAPFLVRNTVVTSTDTIINRIVQSNNYCNDYEYDHKTNDKSKYCIFKKIRAFSRIINTQHCMSYIRVFFSAMIIPNIYRNAKYITITLRVQNTRRLI